MSREETQTSRRAPHWAHGLVKLIACTVGLPLSTLAVSSLLGLWTTTVWLQLGGAIAIVLVVPLLLADRLLPRGDLGSARGLVTDVLAFVWMGLATATVALGVTVLHGPLHDEADRLEARGWSRAASLARWLAPIETVDLESTTDLQVAHVAPELVIAVEAPEQSAVEIEEETPTDETTETTSAEQATPSPSDETTSQPRRTLDPAELFENWAPSVVTVKMKTPFGFGGTGTGFIVSSDGLIATNDHVIAGGGDLEVKLFDDTVVEEVEILSTDAAVDLAILKVKTDQALVPVALGDSAAVKVGEPVIVIGNPLGLEHTLSDGLLSARRLYQGKRYIQMTAPVSPGNSGGPVFNRYGEVIGVTVAKVGYGAGENLNLAVPVDQLDPLLDSAANGGKTGRSRW
jgi:serine protease Do